VIGNSFRVIQIGTNEATKPETPHRTFSDRFQDLVHSLTLNKARIQDALLSQLTMTQLFFPCAAKADSVDNYDYDDEDDDKTYRSTFELVRLCDFSK
jgi:hypothetical protein